MSNKENTVKELKHLLETAQRELLKEINANRNFFQKMFGKSETLQLVQSNLAKALNQVGNLKLNDSGAVSKIQTHLNEKTQDLATAQSKLEALEDQNIILNNKVKLLENQVQELRQKSETKVEVEETTAVSETAAVENNTNNEELENLQAFKADLLERFDASQEALHDSQNLTTELNKRLKRLKTELLTN